MIYHTDILVMRFFRNNHFFFYHNYINMASKDFQQAGVELAQILAQKSGVSAGEIMQSGSEQLSEAGVCDGMVLRSGFCKPSRGGKRKRMNGGACTRKLAKSLAGLAILAEITGSSALIYVAAPVESVALVFACRDWLQATMQGFLASLSAGINLRSKEIITLLWSLGVAYYGNTRMVGGIVKPLSDAVGEHFNSVCEKVEEYLESREGATAAAAAKVDASATGGARRRRTYKKRGGARRGGTRGSCGMSGGKKRKSRRRKSRGHKSHRRKSRGHKSHRRKSRVHRKRRGHKSKKH